MNEIKRSVIIKLLRDFERTKSIHTACTVCDILIEELNAGRLTLD